MDATFSSKVTTSICGSSFSTIAFKRPISVGCQDLSSCNPCLCLFRTVLPWHGDPPPTITPLTRLFARKGANIASSMDSTVLMWMMLGKFVCAIARAWGSFSAAMAQKVQPMDNRARHKPLMPAHKSKTSHLPRRIGTQGAWKISPRPFQWTGLEAANLLATSSEECPDSAMVTMRAWVWRSSWACPECPWWISLPTGFEEPPVLALEVSVSSANSHSVDSECSIRVWDLLKQGLPLGSLTSHWCKLGQCFWLHPLESFHCLHSCCPPFHHADCHQAIGLQHSRSLVIWGCTPRWVRRSPLELRFMEDSLQSWWFPVLTKSFFEGFTCTPLLSHQASHSASGLQVVSSQPCETVRGQMSSNQPRLCLHIPEQCYKIHHQGISTRSILRDPIASPSPGHR